MLSVVITAWNEAKNLPRAVASVKQFAGEIVVVDTESTDSTAEIARNLGCRVYKHKNMGIVEPVRNFSIGKAKGDWILLLDADEEIGSVLADKIVQILAKPEADFYRIPRKSIIFGKWISSAHWWPDYVYRLFRAGSVSWDNTIHSVPFTKGIGGDLPADLDMAIIHHHYDSISQYVGRMNRYTDKQAEDQLAKGYNFSWKDIVNKPISEFINQYFARKGFQDGLHGVTLASLQAFSELVLYLKLWQTGGFVEQDIKVSQLKNELLSKANEYSWWERQISIESANFVIRPVLKLMRRVGV